MRGNNPENRLPNGFVPYEQSAKREVPTQPHLRKGNPLAVLAPIVIPPREIIDAAMTFNKSIIPFYPDTIPEEAALDVHVRSRWAHLGIHVEDVNRRLMMLLFKNAGNDFVMTFPIKNLGDSPVELDGGIFHFFTVPPAALVQGDELEDMLTKQSEFGETIVLGGENGQVTHAYVKASDKRFVIPRQEEPIKVADFETFEDVRDHLKLKGYFKQVNPGEIRENQLYIAAMPDIKLPVDRYIIIGEKAYTRMPNGRFLETGIHLRSPLVEARSNSHGHNLELIKGDWVRIEVARNGSELVAG